MQADGNFFKLGKGLFGIHAKCGIPFFGKVISASGYWFQKGSCVASRKYSVDIECLADCADFVRAQSFADLSCRKVEVFIFCGSLGIFHAICGAFDRDI